VRRGLPGRGLPPPLMMGLITVATASVTTGRLCRCPSLWRGLLLVVPQEQCHRDANHNDNNDHQAHSVTNRVVFACECKKHRLPPPLCDADEDDETDRQNNDDDQQRCRHCASVKLAPGRAGPRLWLAIARSYWREPTARCPLRVFALIVNTGRCRRALN
jgi:hypothetical protein